MIQRELKNYKNVQKRVRSSVRAANDRQTIVQQDGVETLHQHRATLKQETGLSSLLRPEQSFYQADT